MTVPTIDAIISAFSTAAAATDVDYVVLPANQMPKLAHLGSSRAGYPSLLIPVQSVPSETLRLTKGVALRGVPLLEFAVGAERWRVPVAVVECREPTLLRTFAAMAAAIMSRVGDSTPTWDMVLQAFVEWEALLARRQLLAEGAELGLWGELWCLVHSGRRIDLVAAWRGPDCDPYDFFLDAHGLEIKTSRQHGVHIVSQRQVDDAAGDAPVTIVSLFVAQDPIRGRTLADMVNSLSIADTNGPFEETLSKFGYSRGDEAAYTRRFVVLEPPSFYRAEDIPRVRAADAGVSHLRYRVEMPADRVLSHEHLSPTFELIGFDPTKLDYPCA